MNSITTETRLTGLPVSGGIALAKVCLFNETRHNNLPMYKVGGEGAEREAARLQRAIGLATHRLEGLIHSVTERIGPAEGQIFQVQKMILNDPVLLAEMLGEIEQRGTNAEAAVTARLDAYESRLQELDDEYLKERATDIGEVRRRLLDMLANLNPSLQCAGQAHCQRGRERIVVAVELTPSVTLELDSEHTRGFVTERGGVNSHAAIVARGLRIPAVSGVEKAHSLLTCGTELLLNGYTGEVIVRPSAETIARHAPALPPAVTTAAAERVDGLAVMANISRSDDVAGALAAGAEGIGLYRTEFEFLAAGELLDEEAQFHQYAAVVDAMAGRPVYFRLLDIGGDKTAPCFGLPAEVNPSLGYRGSRLLEGRPELLRPQARALVRASARGPVHVMYPMIVELEQFTRLRGLFDEMTADLPAGPVHHGVMFEVPSACMEAHQLLAVADFASIGTNDLIQYFFAVDRDNELVAYDYSPDRPAFWALLADLVAAAVAAGRPLSICGELAGDPRWVGKLMDLGITAISASPRLIGDLRTAAREHVAAR